jgi:phosphomannomutase
MSGELQCPWVHLRASNTEPIARIIAEATSREEASALCDEVEQILADCKSRI